MKIKNTIKRQSRFFFMRNVYRKTGDLACEYCGQVDLIMNHREDPEIPKYRRATIDHIVPLKQGGGLKDRNNWCVACQECNELKGSKSVEKFMELFNGNI